MKLEKIKVKLDDGAICPTRAHSLDAGLDLYAPEDFVISGSKAIQGYSEFAPVECGHYFVDTGVHIEIPAGYVGYIKSKSGLMCENGITTDGTVDAGYTGSIGVMLINHGRQSHVFKRGQKIAQIVIQPIETPEIEIVDELEQTERGNGGFGSTGA